MNSKKNPSFLEVFPTEISLSRLVDLPLDEIAAEALFGDISSVPTAYHGACQKAKDFIRKHIQRLFHQEGVRVVDDMAVD